MTPPGTAAIPSTLAFLHMRSDMVQLEMVVVPLEEGQERSLRPDRCERCRFWEPDSLTTLPDFGDCRRHAPFVKKPTREGCVISTRGEWPYTAADDFCGEFQPKGD